MSREYNEMTLMFPSNVHLCNSLLLVVLLVSCLPYYVKNTLDQSSSNWTQKSLCREGTIYCASSNTCLEVRCVYNFFNELEECPMGTIYCPDTDECLYNCPTTQKDSSMISKKNLELEIKREDDVVENFCVSPLKAFFRPSMGSLVLTFSQFLWPQGNVKCEELFDDKSLIKFGEEPDCDVFDTDIVIYMKRKATIKPLDVLKIRSPCLVTAVNHHIFNQMGPDNISVCLSGEVKIDTPYFTVAPGFEIYGDRQICTNSTVLEIVNTCGSAANKLTFFYKVGVYQAKGRTGADELSREMMKILSSQTGPNITLHNISLPIGIHFVLFVTASNRFGIKSLNSYLFDLVRVTKPYVVNIHGPQILNVMVENIFEAEVTNCKTGLKDDQDFKFTWTIFPPHFEIPPSANKRLVIPSKTLQGGNSYLLTVNAKTSVVVDVYTVTIVTDLRNITVVPSVNSAIINNKFQYTLSVGLSQDPNNLPTDFEYHWQCMKDNIKCSKNFTSTDQPDFIINPADLESGVYTFQANVSKSFFSDYVKIPVRVSSENIPQIHLERTFANYLHNVEEDLYIKAYVTDAETVLIEWSSLSQTTEGFVDLRELSFHNITGPTNWTVESPQYQEFSLLLPKPNKSINWNGLRSDAVYIFSLRVFSQDTNRDSASTLILLTNSGPRIHSFNVEPQNNGQALKTNYKITFDDSWDEMCTECPIRVELLYLHPNEKTPTHVTVLQNGPPRFTLLLPGDEKNITNLTLILKVCDIYQGCTQTSQTVLVHPTPSLTISDIHHLSNMTSRRLHFGMIDEALALSRSVVQTVNTYQNAKELVSQTMTLFQDHINYVSNQLYSEFTQKINGEASSRQYHNLVSAVRESIKSSHLRDSTFHQLSKLRLAYFKSKLCAQGEFLTAYDKACQTSHLSELPISSLKPNQIHSSLLLDEIELKKRHTDESLANVLKNMKFYSSVLCSAKVSESIFSDLLRVDSNTVKLMVKNIDYNVFEESRIVNISFDEERPEKYVTLTKELADQVKGWNSNINTASQKNSFCLALGEVSNSIAIRHDSNIISPLIWFNLINPWIRHAHSPSKLDHYFVVPVLLNQVPMNGQFKCVIFNITKDSTGIIECQILGKSSTCVYCGCRFTGYVGLIEIDKNENKTWNVNKGTQNTSFLNLIEETPSLQEETESSIVTTDVYISSSSFFVDASPIITSINLKKSNEIPTEFVCNETTDSGEDIILISKNEPFQAINLSEALDTTEVDYSESEISWSSIGSTGAGELTKSTPITDLLWTTTKDFSKNVCNVTLILCGEYEVYINQDTPKAIMNTWRFLSQKVGMQNARIKNLRLTSGSIVVTFQFYTSDDIDSRVHAFVNLKEIKFVTDIKGNQYPVDQIIISDHMYRNITTIESSSTTSITTTPVPSSMTTLSNLSSPSQNVSTTTDQMINFNNSKVIKVDFIIEDDFNNAREWGLDEYSNNVFNQIKQIIGLPLACFEHFMLTGQHYINVSFELKALPEQNITMAQVKKTVEKFFKLLLEEKLVISDRNGKELKMLPAYASVATTEETEGSEVHHEPSANANSHDVVIIIVICLGCGFVLLVGIIVVNYSMKTYFKKKYKKQIFPHNGMGIHDSIFNVWNEKGEILSRANTMSADKYSYDSGIWLARQRRNFQDVPEPAVYTPPLDSKEYNLKKLKSEANWLSKVHNEASL